MRGTSNGPNTAVHIDPPGGIETAMRAAELLKALANPHRLMIMRLLREAPRTVMDLCSILGLRQSLVSQHLARLRLDGVVQANRQGHFVIYAVSDFGASRILDTLFDVIASSDSIVGSVQNTWKSAVTGDKNTNTE